MQIHIEEASWYILSLRNATIDGTKITYSNIINIMPRRPYRRNAFIQVTDCIILEKFLTMYTEIVRTLQLLKSGV